MSVESFASQILGAPGPSASAPSQNEVITTPPQSGPGSGYVTNPGGSALGATPRPYSTDGGVCIQDPPDSWDFQFVTLNYSGVAPNAMLADFFVQLPRPVKKLFMVGNNSPTGQALFIHFNKLQKYQNGVIEPIFGNESWIPFPGGEQMHGVTGGAASVGLTDASFIKFCKPISKFYCTIFNGAGAGPAGTGWNVTLLATDDIDMEYSNAV
jgi:hypothetical protein